MKWKWSNVPIPVQHLLGLVVGTILQFMLKHKLFAFSWIGHVIGWPLIATGVGLSAWSVIEAGDIDVESPTKLLTGGPYSLSRNPMYIAWTLIYLGIALATNWLWVFALLSLIIAFTHFVDIRMEERFLREQFGEEYLEYQRRVRRYF